VFTEFRLMFLWFHKIRATSNTSLHGAKQVGVTLLVAVAATLIVPDPDARATDGHKEILKGGETARSTA
jgi:hypothetical protein